MNFLPRSNSSPQANRKGALFWDGLAACRDTIKCEEVGITCKHNYINYINRKEFKVRKNKFQKKLSTALQCDCATLTDEKGVERNERKKK